MALSPQKNKEEAEGKQGKECLYVKVSMDGAPYLRKVDLRTYFNYKELSLALEKMFSCFLVGKLGSSQSFCNFFCFAAAFHFGYLAIIFISYVLENWRHKMPYSDAIACSTEYRYFYGLINYRGFSIVMITQVATDKIRMQIKVVVFFLLTLAVSS